MANAKIERSCVLSRKKVKAVLGILYGEELDLVLRVASMTAATLVQWREHFVTSEQVGLRSLPLPG